MSDPIDQFARGAEPGELALLMGLPCGTTDGIGQGKSDEPSTTNGPDTAHDSGTNVGRYTLLERIGEGGFGTVFLAEQSHPVRRQVALKIIKLGMDTKQVIARFEAERQALAMMDHPGVARVIDAGATPTGHPYFVMDLIRGVPITRYCDDEKLTIRQRLELFVQVCQAVQHAHTKGIIHRDLKPSNILVTINDGVAVPKVIDFGIAKATTGQLTDQTLLTELRQLLGTPQYMSPEQADGSADIDTRADIYSLGVILYELLTGTTPFDATELRSRSYPEIQRLVREVDPPRPSTRLSAVPPDQAGTIASTRSTDSRRLTQTMRGELDWIVLKALEKDRARRYQTAAALAADADRHLNDEPIQARPASALYRLKKLARKHRVGFAAAGAIATALVVGIVGLSVGLVHAHRAQIAAQNEAHKARTLSQFITGILALARPEAGGNVRVRDLLKLASKEAGTKLRDQPEVEVEARLTLSYTYFALGMYAESQTEIDRAQALSVELDQGRVSARTLRLAIQQAVTLDATTPDDDPTPLRLARQTYETSQNILAESDPARRICAALFAYVLVSRDHPAEAEPILRKLMAQPELMNDDPANDDFPPEFLISNLNHALRNQGKATEQTIESQRQMVARIKRLNQPAPRSLVIVCAHLGVMLADQGRQGESLATFREALNIGRERLGVTHDLTQWVTTLYALALRRNSQFDTAFDLLKENVQQIRSVQPGDSKPLAASLVKQGMLQVDRRQREGIPIVLEGMAMMHRLGGGLDPDSQGAFRSALLSSLGSWDCAADGNLPAQVYCALDEIFLDHPSQLLDLARLSPGSVHCQLRRWGGAEWGSVAQDTLDRLSGGRGIDPGLYSLTLDVPQSGSVSLHQTQWLLFAPWEYHVYLPQRPLLHWRGIGPGAPDAIAWEQTIAQKPLSPPQKSPSFAFMSQLKASPARDGRDEEFDVVADTAIELPAGRYRFLVTSDDGVRLYVDGRRIIDDWTPHAPRRDSSELRLSAGRHHLKVEHFQAGGSYKLWVRVEPLDHAAG